MRQGPRCGPSALSERLCYFAAGCIFCMIPEVNSVTKNPSAAPPRPPPKVATVSFMFRLIDG